MRKWLAALALLGVVATACFFWRRPATPVADTAHDNSAQSTATPPGSTVTLTPVKPSFPGQPAYASAATPSADSSAMASATTGATRPAAAGNSQEPDFTDFPPEIVLEKVGHAIHDYASMFGGNPVGTNPEITAALGGKNPRQANFINLEAGMRINGNGELVDAWGTPYFFHQISGTEMEIHSAGPDRIMWTSDDLVTR